MDETIWPVMMFVTIVALALVALVLDIRALRDMRGGLPIKDERSRALNAKAGYYALYTSAYTTLALGVIFILLEDRDITLPNSELLFIVVAIMGSMHIAFRTYLNRRGRRSSA
ncbi:MAG TPA: hypothetical protein HA364_08210 [Thermoplasmata archaeon]|nr:hypothetical protein [Thermoplasmata archaeon]